MSAVVETPIDFLESISKLRLPPRIDERLQELMDANTEGTLTAEELEELTTLVEWSQDISIYRARAMLLLKAKS
jgi:hypothetical protein